MGLLDAYHRHSIRRSERQTARALQTMQQQGAVDTERVRAEAFELGRRAGWAEGWRAGYARGWQQALAGRPVDPYPGRGLA